MNLKPGDLLIQVDHGWGGPMTRHTAKVERITPTGIVVLSNGERLKASTYRDDAYEVRGSSSWRRGLYYTPDHEVVEAARERTRLVKSRQAVDAAYDEWRSALGKATARSLAKAASDFAKLAES